MTLDDRVRTALRERAERIESLPDRWDEITRAGVRRPARHEGRRRLAAGAVAFAVAALGIGLAVFAMREEPRDIRPDLPGLPGDGRAVRAFDGWTVSVSVEPARVGPIAISLGPLERAHPNPEGIGWIEHRIRFENTGDTRVTFADTRTSAFLDRDGEHVLIASDEGCGFVPGSRIRVGVCAAYLDAMTLAPGDGESREIMLLRGLPGMAPLHEGVYVFERTIRFAEGSAIPEEGEGRTATLTITYEVQAVRGEGTTQSYTSDLAWTAEVPEGWDVLEFGGFNGRYSVSGAAFSNEPLHATEDGTYPDLSQLFPDGAAVIVSHSEGGPAPDVLSDDSSFPLEWEDLEAVPGGLVVGSILDFRANGLDLTVGLAIRADAPADLLEDARAIVESIRPTALITGEELRSGFVAIDAGAVAEVGSGAVVELETSPFMVVHAPGGYYALDLPKDVPDPSEFSWDAAAAEVVWTQDGEVFARYDREGRPVLTPPGADLVPLEIHPVVRAWDGEHLLLHPGVTYGPLSERWP